MQVAVRKWRKVDEMTEDEVREEIIELRSEVSNLRRNLRRYRSIVSGIRGSVAALNALVCADDDA